ncbi:hypothetical protein EZH22_24695 [Xanthobacter dioxanivorans]|uniref:Uncharacterized protein n=1 Tax=Xanthobacter dioxanivorans TaxID=2528964 RepID=A0A974PM45_9HYPH|nr:hypothetical protein [Xanthobacter dioxanivorans]QRG06148.1 hypothetical protein EZH22_24695 [Xanthobacter dioxanivorans]
MSDKTRQFVEPVRKMLAEGINVQALGDATNQIIEGAFQSLVEHIDELEMDLASLRTAVALASTQAPQPGGAVKVKALEWVKCHAGYSAEVPFGEYGCDLDQDEEVALYPWICSSPEDILGHCETLDEAKAAAQADYERRILAALEPTPAPSFAKGAEAMDWRERDLDLIAAHEKVEAFKAGAKAMQSDAAALADKLGEEYCTAGYAANKIRDLPLPTPPAGEG